MASELDQVILEVTKNKFILEEARNVLSYSFTTLILCAFTPVCYLTDWEYK